jgi:ATP-binding cassette subfamily B multidrug efflux pump
MLFGKYLNKYYVRYWYLFLAVIFFDTLVDVVQLFIPKILGTVITQVTEKTFTVVADPDNGLFWYQTDLTKVLFEIGVIAIIIVLGRIGWRFFSAQIGANIERDLRKEMYTHIQTLSLTYYKDKKVGGLLSFFTNDLQTIKQTFTEGLIFFTDLTILGSLSFVYMMLMSWQITLFSAIPLLLFVILGGVIGKGEAKRYETSSDAFESLSDFTEENLQGFSVVKAFLKERERVNDFRGLAKDAQNKNIRYLRYSTWIDISINLFLTAFWTILMFLSCYSVLIDNSFFLDNIKTSGDVVTFSGYYDALIWPMIAGGLLINDISRGRGSYRRIAEILSSKADVIDDPKATEKGILRGDIEFRDLTFNYPDGPAPVLKDISFHIAPGSTVGIIGRTGSGKSTLVNLLPKLYNIPKGMLFIDGADINYWEKAELRERIGLVSQEAFLFSGPIKENIAFSEKVPHQVDMEKVKKAAQFSCVDEDIEAFPEKYDTLLGEKGATVSGGQRQRISISRAIYKNPQVLILDDSLSAVDADTEKKILANIRSYRNGLTTFIIAHRVSAIEDSDLILVLDDGKLVGKGTHQELIASCPLYADIVKLQELEKEVD